MKKILTLGIIILSIFIIYLTTIDRKVYFLALGDQISLGQTTDNNEKNYNEYPTEYLKQKNKLEKSITEFSQQGYRITDIINDIKNNKELNNKITIKNALIKADLVTISIGTNDIITKIDTENKLNNIDYNRLYKNIKEILIDLEKLFDLLRQYCKEDIILVGININTTDKKINEMIKFTNEKFKEISNKYRIIYIDCLEEKIENKIYPTKENYKELGDRIIEIINKNLLK